MAIQIIFNASVLLQNLQTALQSDAALAPLADDISDAGKDTFTPETLEKLCDRIGGIHPSLGCQLLLPVVKARAARDRGETNYAWREFTEILGEREVNSGEKTPSPLVAFTLFKKISMILNGAQRKPWLAEGLKRLAIPDVDRLLNAPVLRLDERNKILLKIDRGKSDIFVSHNPEDISDAGQMTLRIEAPQKWNKPLDEKTLQLLIARTIAVAVLKYLAGSEVAQKYQKITPGLFSQPIPLVVVDRNGWTQFGPPPLPKRVEQDWKNMQRWIIDGSILFAAYQSSKHAAARAQPGAHLNAGGQSVDPASITPFWIELMQLPNAPDILSKMLGNIIPSQPLFFRIVTTISAEADPNTIKVLLGEAHHKISLFLSMKDASLKALQNEEILELLWRVMNIGQTHSKERRKKGGNPFNGVEYDLSDLKEPKEETEEERLGGSLLKLLFTGHRFLNEEHQTADFQLTGLSGTERKIFMSALAERHRTARGSRSTVGKKWIVREAGMEDRGGVIEIIPLKRVTLIHIHGRAADLSKQDWLFLMQTLDAQDAALLKISLESREILSGSR